MNTKYYDILICDCTAPVAYTIHILVFDVCAREYTIKTFWQALRLLKYIFEQTHMINFCVCINSSQCVRQRYKILRIYMVDRCKLYYIYDKSGKYHVASNNNTAETDTYIPCDV